MNLKKLLGFLAIIILTTYSLIGVYIFSTDQISELISKLMDGLYAILQLLGIAFLLLTTNVKQNHKRKLVRLGDLMIIVGAGILILHFPSIIGYSLISFGLFMIFIDQIVRLRNTEDDLFIEGMKIFWYLLFWTGVILRELHLTGGQTLVFISVVALWLVIIGYLFKHGLPKYTND